MKGFGKKVGILGLIFWIIPCVYGVAYDMQCSSIFINNKTDQKLLIRFYNEYDDEQQRYESLPNEHREVRLKNGVMKRLVRVSVTMKDPETREDVMRDIDYENDPKNKIVGLEVTMDPGLELRWHYEDDDLVKNPPATT